MATRPLDVGVPGGPDVTRLLWGTRAFLLAALVVAGFCLPDHVGAGWTVFGAAAVLAAGVEIRLHPPAYRTPLCWVAAALLCLLAAQACVLAGVRPAPPSGTSVIDLFVFAADIAAAGVLFVVISRRVRGWDGGFVLDVCLVVGAVTSTVWLYLIAPYVMPRSESLLLTRLTVTMYPTVVVVLCVLGAMTAARVRGRTGTAVLLLGVAGLVYSSVFMLVTRVRDVTAHGFWNNAAAAGAGWMLFQACWATAALHVPSPRCPSAAGHWPRRPMTLTRLLVLLVVALVNPLVLNIQITLGRVAPLGHFPAVGGTVFAAVIIRLSFIGAEHMASVRRLNALIESQPRLAGADSAAELTQLAAEVAGRLLGGRGETVATLVSGGRVCTGGWHAPDPLLRPDPDRWSAMVAAWPEQAEAGKSARFLSPQEVPGREGAGSVTALACPIHTARSRGEGRPHGLLVVAGTAGRVTAAADLLALLAAQVGESLERIGVTMRMARNHLRAMTANVSDAILVIDDTGRVRYANIAAEALFGGQAGRGRMLADLVGADYAQSLAASAEQEPQRWTLPGGDHIVEAAVDDRRADPTVEGLVLTLRDVTKLHTLENELRRRATHDQETGLENRLAFTTHLAQARAGEGTEFGVLAVSIDDLAEIAEESGPEQAHRVLDEFARRLVAVFGLERPEVARVEPGTLALLVSGTPALPAAQTLLARARSAGARPLTLAGRSITVSVSAGFAGYPSDRPGEQALEDALLALRAAQRSSPRGLAAFTPALRATSREQAELRAGLNEALRDEAFFLEYQPVVDLATRAPLGAEALIRWRKPHGTVRPDVFVPFAEQTGQIVPMGAWVLRRAVRDYLSWPRPADAGRRLRVNVNVSPVQLREPDFLPQIRALLGETGLPPDALVLEVTESGIVAQVETLVQARGLGVGVAMDDFGTGYSSLSSLRRLPISTVKIDKAFVDGIATDPVQRALVEGIVRLAEELGLNTVAEGVEGEEQHARLLAAGCRCGQGYLYSPPLPAADFEAWLREHG